MTSRLEHGLTPLTRLCPYGFPAIPTLVNKPWYHSFQRNDPVADGVVRSCAIRFFLFDQCAGVWLASVSMAFKSTTAMRTWEGESMPRIQAKSWLIGLV